MTALARPKEKKDSSENENGNENEEEVATVEPDNMGSMTPGVAFWVGVKSAGIKTSLIENNCLKLFSQCGFSVRSCKVCLSSFKISVYV